MAWLVATHWSKVDRDAGCCIQLLCECVGGCSFVDCLFVVEKTSEGDQTQHSCHFLFFVSTLLRIKTTPPLHFLSFVSPSTHTDTDFPPCCLLFFTPCKVTETHGHDLFLTTERHSLSFLLFLIHFPLLTTNQPPTSIYKCYPLTSTLLARSNNTRHPLLTLTLILMPRMPKKTQAATTQAPPTSTSPAPSGREAGGSEQTYAMTTSPVRLNNSNNSSNTATTTATSLKQTLKQRNTTSSSSNGHGMTNGQRTRTDSKMGEFEDSADNSGSDSSSDRTEHLDELSRWRYFDTSVCCCCFGPHVLVHQQQQQ